MFQLLDSEYKTATWETLGKEDTDSQRRPDREDLSEMTRHEEGRADGRLASGKGFQLEDRSVPVSGAVSRKAGRRDWQCFHRKEMVSERCIYAHL